MWYRQLRTSVRSLGKDESGANAVEFALVILVLIPFILAILEFGILLFTYNNMVQTARETARVLAVREYTWLEAQPVAQAVVEVQLGMFNALNFGYCICQAQPPPASHECYFEGVGITPCPSKNTKVDEVEARIAVPLAEASLIDFFGFFSLGNLTATVTMRKEPEPEP